MTVTRDQPFVDTRRIDSSAVLWCFGWRGCVRSRVCCALWWILSGCSVSPAVGWPPAIVTERSCLAESPARGVSLASRRWINQTWRRRGQRPGTAHRAGRWRAPRTRNESPPSLLSLQWAMRSFKCMILYKYTNTFYYNSSVCLFLLQTLNLFSSHFRLYSEW